MKPYVELLERGVKALERIADALEAMEDLQMNQLGAMPREKRC